MTGTTRLASSCKLISSKEKGSNPKSSSEVSLKEGLELGVPLLAGAGAGSATFGGLGRVKSSSSKAKSSSSEKGSWPKPMPKEAGISPRGWEAGLPFLTAGAEGVACLLLGSKSSKEKAAMPKSSSKAASAPGASF